MFKVKCKKDYSSGNNVIDFHNDNFYEANYHYDYEFNNIIEISNGTDIKFFFHNDKSFYYIYNYFYTKQELRKHKISKLLKDV